MPAMKVRPARSLRGHLARLPGDKSVSHRAALLGALAAGGRTRVTNYSASADCASTLRCVAQLGVTIRREGSDVLIGDDVGDMARAPAWPRLLRAPGGALDCGNSGTTMRLLAGALAAQPFAATLTGDDSLRSRPMKRIVEPLEMMGARLRASEGGRAPLCVEGRRPLKSVRYEMPIASAQVKSALLVAGLGAEGRTQVVEPVATRDHTERMLRWFGVPVEVEAVPRVGADSAPAEAEGGSQPPRVISVNGPAGFEARDVSVPGDISAAAFFLAAAAMLPGSELTVEGVGLNPTRAGLVEVMRGLGAHVEVEGAGLAGGEEVGNLFVRGEGGLAPASARANVLRGPVVARLIDELPMLAVLGTRVGGGLEIRDAAELRVKESDRIAATVENLREMGAEVEEYGDGLAVRGGARLRGAKINSRGDHRIAMAFAVAALTAEGESWIDGAECVAVSFPDFFGVLASVTER